MRGRRARLAAGGRCAAPGGASDRVRGVLVVVVLGVALVLGLVVVGVLLFELLGHVTRTRRALDAAAGELVPAVRALTSSRSAGRHRAGGGPAPGQGRSGTGADATGGRTT